MRKFSQDEWYFDGYTWCGITEEGEHRYPVSYGDNGMAWAMTTDINRCLNFYDIKSVAKMIKAYLKHDPFFKHHYKKIELVYIKEYPTFYFDYLRAAKQLKIKVNHLRTNEALESYLKKYGFEPISTNPKIIEVSRDNGEFYAEIINDTEKDKRKIDSIRIKNSCFNYPTYLLRSRKDLDLLFENVKDAQYVAAEYDEEINGFSSLYYENVYFPCFAVVNGRDSMVYSVDDVQKFHDNAASMLKLVKKGAK